MAYVVKDWKARSGYCYGQSQQHSGWIGPTCDHTFLREWYLAKLLYPKMALRNEWTLPPVQDDTVASQDAVPDNGFISDLAFSKDGRKLVAGSTNNNMYIFEPNTGKSRAVIRGAHADAVSRVCFVSDTQFVSGSADSTISLWDIRKTVKSVNILVGHNKPIRSLDYDYDEDLLTSSSFDCDVRYWHIPSLQIERSNVDKEETENYRGVVLTCPNLNQACLYGMSGSKKLVCLNAHGTLYVIDNLELRKLKADMRSLRLDDSLMLQLSWFNPNADLKKTNRIRVIPADDYCPDVRAKVSKVYYATFHPSLPLLLLRVATTKRLAIQQQTKDWTCMCNLQHVLGVSDITNHYTAAGAFGTDILEEKLIFAEEETRFASLREKRPTFSTCGRIVASPHKNGLRLLGFSEDLHTPLENKATKSANVGSAMSSLFSNDFWPTEAARFTTVKHLEREPNSTICTSFSPHGMLLAVGDSNEHVSFYQPTV